MTKYLILSLGELVTPNAMNGIQALAKLVAEKKSEQPQHVLPLIGKIIVEQNASIDAFKFGNLTEEKFDQIMLAAIENSTGAKLSVKEFNAAWNLMNPSFEQFFLKLKSASEINSQTDTQIILLSFTNPKDMRCLVKQLLDNGQSVNLDKQENPKSICDMPLHLSYVTHKNKKDILDEVVEKITEKAPISTQISKNLFQALPEVVPNITSILGYNNITEPTLRKNLDREMQQMEKEAEKLHITTLMWNSDELTLTSLLQQKPEQQETHVLSIAALSKL